MTDIGTHETRLTMQQVAEEFGVCVKTVYGWVSQVDHLKRPKNYLRTFKFGGTRYTLRAWLLEFAQDAEDESVVLPADATATTAAPALPELPPVDPQQTSHPRKLPRGEARREAVRQELRERHGIGAKK